MQLQFNSNGISLEMHLDIKGHSSDFNTFAHKEIEKTLEKLKYELESLSGGYFFTCGCCKEKRGTEMQVPVPQGGNLKNSDGWSICSKCAPFFEEKEGECECDLDTDYNDLCDACKAQRDIEETNQTLMNQ